MNEPRLPSLVDDADPLVEEVPGRDHQPSRPHPLPEDWTDLADLLEEAARDAEVASAKARGLVAASELRQASEEPEAVVELAREASETVPKLGVVTLRHRHVSHGEDFDLQQRNLEATVRLATHPATRLHASLLLARGLQRRGQSERAGAVLDHAAHTGVSDLRLMIDRLIFRLASRQTTAGLELPEELGGAAAEIGELLGNRAAGEQTTILGLHRVARALHEGNVLDAAARLESSELDVATSTELAAALRAVDREGLDDSKRLLRSIVRTAPTRSAIRTLALQCVETADHETLAALLSSADPGSGTFTMFERLIIASIAKLDLPLSDEDLAALHSQHAWLTMALAPQWPLCLDAETASEDLLAATLGRVLTLSDPKVEAASLLMELENRGQWSSSYFAYRMYRAARDQDAETLGELVSTIRTEDPCALEFLAGSLYALANASEAAELAYARALESGGDAASRYAALRALFSLPQQEEQDDAGKRYVLTQVYNQETSEQRRIALSAEMLAHCTRQEADEVLESRDVPSFAIARAALLTAPKEEAAPPEDDGPALEAARVAEREGIHPWTRKWLLTRSVLSMSSSSAAHAVRNERHDEAAPEDRGASLALESWFDAGRLDREEPPDGSSWLHALALASALHDHHLERAAVQARIVHEGTPTSFSGALWEELEELLGNSERLTQIWLERSKTDDAEQRRYAYERLSELDEVRGDEASALLWQRAIAEEFPEYLPALFRVEEALLGEGRLEEWGSVRDKLAHALPAPQNLIYRLMAGAQHLAKFDLRAATRMLKPLLDIETPPLFALRTMHAAALEDHDNEARAALDEHLLAHAHTDLDQLSLTVSAACSSALGDQAERARNWARRATELRPQSFAALCLLHELETEEGDLLEAERLELLAQNSASSLHKGRFWLQAGQRWLDLEDEDRACRCFEEVLEVEPDNTSAFERVCTLYEKSGRQEDLAKRFTERLSFELSDEERTRLQLSLALVLADLERPDEARDYLEKVLSSTPEDTDALRAHAEVCAQLGEHASAEQSLVALKDRMEPGRARIDVLRSLGKMYERHLQDLEKAMDTYEAVLEAEPDDRTTGAALVKVFSELGLAERATSLQTRIIRSATTQEEKRRGALVLARLYEQVGRDPQRAAATLDRARRAWPLDADVIQATAELMGRRGEEKAMRLLLGRVGKDARRKLESGRLDAAVLDTLARVALLSEQPVLAQTVAATRAAYVGEEFSIFGAGEKALSNKLDDLVAPDELPPPLRHLIRKTGPALDAAFPIDLGSMGATQITSGPVIERMQSIAQKLELPAPEVAVTDFLGARCLPLTLQPLRMAIGSRLQDLEPRALDFVLFRAFKLQQIGAGALARSRPEDGFPMLVALLHLFSPNWRPQGVDARKAAQAKALIEQGLARVGYDDDVPTLALEAIGAMRKAGPHTSIMPRLMANRAALLAVGNPRFALDAFSSAESKPLPPSGPSRFRWIESHPEGKDVLLYATTEKCALAREHLKLGPSSERTTSSQEKRPPPPRRGPPAPPVRGNKPPPPRRG